MPLNDRSTLRERQRSMSSERGDEGEGVEGMDGLEEPLRQSKPPLRRESRQGISLKKKKKKDGRQCDNNKISTNIYILFKKIISPLVKFSIVAL